MLKINCLKFLFKYKNNYFESFFKPGVRQSNRPIRSRRIPPRYNLDNITTEINLTFPVIHTNTKTARNCLKHNLIKMLHNQDLPPSLTEKIYTDSYYAMIKYAKKFFINSYKTICTCQLCYSCTPNQGGT